MGLPEEKKRGIGCIKPSVFWVTLWVLMLLNTNISANTDGQNPIESDWGPFEHMVENGQKLDFRGVFTFTQGDVMRSMEIIHRWIDGNIHEKLVQLDGEGGEIVRDGKQVICIFPNDRAVSLEQTGFSSPFIQSKQKIKQLENNYQFTPVSGDRVAGIEAIKYSLMSRDNLRYSYYLWIEPESGFLLKYVLVDELGQSLERFQYSRIELGAKIALSELAPAMKGTTKLHRLSNTESVDSDSASAINNKYPSFKWALGWQPPGFMETPSNAKDEMPAKKVYSDGLASFSVFLEPVVKEQGMPKGLARLGATTAYSKKLARNESWFDVTIVGEVPPSSAMKVAEAVFFFSDE